MTSQAHEAMPASFFEHPRQSRSTQEESIANKNSGPTLLAHLHQLRCTHDLDGRLLSVDAVSATLLGFPPEEILRAQFRKLVSPRFRNRVEKYLGEVRSQGEARGIVALVARTGERRYWQYHSSLRAEGIDRQVVRCIAHDVTGRVHARKALLEENARLERIAREKELMLRELQLFRTLLDQSNDAIEVIDPATLSFLDVNQRSCAELGYTREELLTMTVFDIDPSITPASVTQTVDDLRKSGSMALERLHRRKDGTTFPVEISLKHVVLDREYLVGVSRDITERKLREGRLQEYERVVESLDEMIAVVDRDHRFVIANRALMNYRGITREQIVGHSIKEVLGEPIYQSKVKPKMEECFRGNIVEYDMKHSYPNLGERDLSITYLPIEGPNGVDRVAAVARDVTDHKRSEEALRSSEERLRLAQEAAQIGTFDRNFLTGESRWTLQQEAIYGLRPGEFPRTIEQFIELVHPDDRQQVSALVAQSMESGEAQGEWRAIWPDGTVRWISGRWRVFRDAEGKPVRAIGSDYDITDRKRIEEELRQAKEKLIEEKLYLEQTIDSELGFEEIVGRSSALRTVMERAGRVAASNATVLLLGETGTGKELVARAIHRLSQRRSNSFIKMNCAAIPTGLLESELFGAEKGAFTGSVSRKVGRLELADKGTIFLDEIGEIASDLQPKLLRVLQDQEFERLGGTQTMKINFRLIAATNRDLADEVQRNHFRSDLYYRLNVFPILIPPLRERREDIPLLVEHFVRKCARRMNKPIARVPSQTLAALVAWDWPGNVRELENFIERSVILTSGSVLAAPLTELQARATSDGRAETLKAAERKHILEALRLSNGRISGENGAAARLGLKRTTLQSKLKQMRIDPRTPPSS